MTRPETALLAALVTCGVLIALAIPEPAASGDLNARMVAAEPLPAGIWTNRAAVVDGDTLRIDGERVRLFGVDAPEKAQTCLDAERRSYACGVTSAAALRAMIAHDPHVTCVAQGSSRDKYGRLIAICSNGGGDLGGRLVALGWAVDYTRYSRGAYKDHEAAAKAERLGMWSGEFVNPSDWRRSRR